MIIISRNWHYSTSWSGLWVAPARTGISLVVLLRVVRSLLLRRIQVVPLPHKSIPLFDPRSLSTRHALPPTLGLFISQRYVASMRVEPLRSPLFSFRQIGATRLARPAPRHRARIGGHRFQHVSLDLRHGEWFSSS
jgi:hypothetical protein